MNAVDRIMTRYRALRYRRPPLPRVDAAAGPVVPGALLRLAAVGLPVATLALAAARTDAFPAYPIALAIALAVWNLGAPGPAAGWATTVATALLLAGSRHAPADPTTAWLAPLAFACYRVSGLAGLAGWTTRVQWAVLWAAWRRDLAVLAVTECLLAVALVATGAGSPWFTALGALALIALAWVVIPRPGSATN